MPRTDLIQPSRSERFHIYVYSYEKENPTSFGSVRDRDSLVFELKDSPSLPSRPGTKMGHEDGRIRNPTIGTETGNDNLEKEHELGQRFLKFGS